MARRTAQTGSTKVEGAKKTRKAREPKYAAFSLKAAPFDVAMPEGFTFDEHKPLKRKDFQHDRFYFAHKAEAYDFLADKMRAAAENAAKYGSRKERTKAKRLERLQAKMNELRAELEADGIDVEALLAGEAETDEE